MTATAPVTGGDGGELPSVPPLEAALRAVDVRPALLRGEVFGAQAFGPVTGGGAGLCGVVARSGRDPDWSP